MTIKDKIKRRHIILFFGAIILLILVKTCKSDWTPNNMVQTQEDVKELQESQDSLMEVADDFIDLYKEEKEIEQKSIDSLNNLLKNNDSLTKDEVDKLNYQIYLKEKQIQAYEENFVVEPVAMVTIDTTPFLNVDTVHIVDTVVIYDTIVEPFVIYDTIYQIDTISYNKKDVKSIKLKKKKD